MHFSKQHAAVLVHIEELARQLTSRSNQLESHLQQIQAQLHVQELHMEEHRYERMHSEERYQQLAGFLVEVFEEIADLAQVHEPCCEVTDDPVSLTKTLSLVDDQDRERYEYLEEVQEICRDMQHEQVLQQRIDSVLQIMQHDKQKLQRNHARTRQALHQVHQKQRMILLAAVQSGLVKLARNKGVL